MPLPAAIRDIVAPSEWIKGCAEATCGRHQLQDVTGSQCLGREG